MTLVRVLILAEDQTTLEDFYAIDPETEYDGSLSSTDLAMLVRSTIENVYDIKVVT